MSAATSLSRPASCAPRGKAGNARSRGERPPIDARFTTGSYFLALVRRHDWPPGFEPQADEARKVAPVPNAAERERQAALGIGWGTGTTPMAGTPKHARPVWMSRGAPAGLAR